MKFTREEFRYIIKNLFILCGAITFYFLVFNFNSFQNTINTLLNYIRPLIFGFVIAFIVNMIMNQFDRLFVKVFKIKSEKTRRIISMILSYLTVVVLFYFILALVLPEFINSIIALLSQLPTLIQNTIARLEEIKWFQDVAKHLDNFVNSIEINNLINSAIDWVRTYGSNIFSDTFNIVTQIFGRFFEIFLAVSLSVYILTGKEKLSRNSKKVVYAFLPEKIGDDFLYVLRLLYKNFYNFFSGQILEAIILGSFVFIGINLIGSPYALMLGVTSAVLNLIPYVGALLGAIIGIVLLAINNPTQGIIFAIYILIVQQIDGNYLYPKLVGGKMGIPSFWIIVAITVGGASLGLLGTIIFVPIVATIYILLKEYSNKKIKEKEIKLDNK